MVNANNQIKNAIDSPVRHIEAKVVLQPSSTTITTVSSKNDLVEFSIDRTSDSGKFFGYGVLHHAKVTLRDINKQYDGFTTESSFKIAYSFGTTTGGDSLPYPEFFVTQTRRDENTNALTIYGYDRLYDASTHYYNELTINAVEYSVQRLANAAATLLGYSEAVFLNLDAGTESAITTILAAGGNYEGTESIKDVLNHIAEFTQTIYYSNKSNQLVFKRLSNDTAVDLYLNKDKYFTLSTDDGRRLSSICHCTELGDNLKATVASGESGSTQYCWDNPLWNLNDDLATLLDNAIAAIGGLTIRQFNCDWRGNFLVEPGDKIALTTKDGLEVHSFLLNDSTEYDGTLRQSSEWKYDDNDTETESNPTSLNDVLKKTYAKVDKVNGEIELMVKEVSSYNERFTEIEKSQDSITTEMGQFKEDYADIPGRLDKVEQDVGNLGDLGDLGDINDKFNSMQQVITSHTEKISGIELDIDSLTTGVSETKLQIEQVRDDLTGDIETVNSSMTNQFTEIKQTQNEINQTVSNTIVQIEGDVTKIQDSIKDLDGLPSPDDIANLGEQVTILTQQVSNKMDADSFEISVEEILKRGTVETIRTSTNYTFDKDGLKISKSDASTSTIIDEDGMTVAGGSENVLVADSEGVQAKNLSATTYIIIGNTTTFTEFRKNNKLRMGAFWTVNPLLVDEEGT